MKKLTKRITATASFVAVAGIVVLGAGGTASAATPASAHVQRPAVSVEPIDYRWDHGLGYLLEQGYSWDAVRGWHQGNRVTDAARHGRSDREGCGWTSDRSYRYDWSHEYDGRNRHDWNHADR
ncbi:hypothetical protein ACWGDS_20715 [Streptomyces sp. NPDC055059]|uniref:hypothetical protein n=1 Tax=Streptomyces sp. NPDC127172 TaxID=3345382 RepID=UPI00362908C4